MSRYPISFTDGIATDDDGEASETIVRPSAVWSTRAIAER